jgi:hypothetical protein
MRGFGGIVALMLLAAGAAAQTLPIEQRQPDSLMLISDDPCCEVLSRIPLPPGRDSAAIEAHRDRAFRAGPVLQLRLIGGRSLRIIDRRPGLETERYYSCVLDNYGDACRFHSLVDWWEEQGYYVVYVGLHEDSVTYLIAEYGGRVSTVVAPPVRSPSGRHAIAFDYNMMNGPRLELIDLGATPPRVLAIEAGPACGDVPDPYLSHLRQKVRWLDDSHITFEGRSFFEKDDPNAKQLLRIVDGKPEWQC